MFGPWGKIIHVEFEGSPRVDRCIPKPSPRENQVLQLWGSGYEADEIAAVLGIACGTVRTRLNSLRGMVGVRTARELRGIARNWQCGFERLYVPIDRVPPKQPLPTSRAVEQLRAQRSVAGIVCV
jgi:DNA-binding CsgD family transcriptional regulator